MRNQVRPIDLAPHSIRLHCIELNDTKRRASHVVLVHELHAKDHFLLFFYFVFCPEILELVKNQELEMELSSLEMVLREKAIEMGNLHIFPILTTNSLEYIHSTHAK